MSLLLVALCVAAASAKSARGKQGKAAARQTVFVGNKQMGSDELHEIVRVASITKRPRSKQLAHEATVIEYAYLERGMAAATVSSKATFDAASKTLTVTHTIKEGRVYRVGTIEICGRLRKAIKSIPAGIRPGMLFVGSELRLALRDFGQRASQFFGKKVGVVPFTSISQKKGTISVKFSDVDESDATKACTLHK